MRYNQYIRRHQVVKQFSRLDMKNVLAGRKIQISCKDLNEHFKTKYGSISDPRMGWGPKLRFHFGYFTPDDFYEIILNKLVTNDTNLLDVGCGRNLFSDNKFLEKTLKDRSKFIAGVDPSDNIDDNKIIDEGYKCSLEELSINRKFNLITMKMVMEHVDDPEKVCETLFQLTEHNGVVVVYTVNKFSPSSIIASITPIKFHHFVKKILWNAEERDTFPTVYKINTKNKLKYYMELAGFLEDDFFLIDDCRSFQKWKFANYFELLFWRFFKKINITYPEFCLIGIYRKNLE